MSRRILFAILLVAGMFCFGPLVDQAQACPMCKAATEADDFLPRAYMYSILFMLAVPATIVSSIGVSLYRLNRKETESLSEIQRLAQEDRDE